MPVKNIEKIKERMKNINNFVLPSFSFEGHGTPSLSVVYGNSGKRITITKTLAKRLDIQSEMQILPIPEDKVLLVAKKFPEDKGVKLTLKGDDKKICYNAGAVQYLVEAFELNYDTVVSKAFSDVSFEKDGDFEFAIVSMIDPKSENDEENSSNNA